MKHLSDKLIPATFDPVFKALLTSEETREYLALLLSEVTGMDCKFIMNNIKIMNSELSVNNYNNKALRTDLLIVIDNYYINLEMNTKYYKGLVERNNCYLGKMLSNAIKRGENYRDSPIAIQINFNKFELFMAGIMINDCCFRNQGCEIESTNIRKYHINLEKIKKKCYDNSKLTSIERVLAMLIVDSKKQAQKLVKGDEILEKALNKLNELSSDEGLMSDWDYERDNEMILKSMLLDSERRGMQEGIEKGMEKGILEIARNMMIHGSNIDYVSKVTNLSVNELQKLQN